MGKTAPMSIVKINAITVPVERGDELAARFAARAGQVDTSEGFEEFQLLRPADDRTTWLVYTRWRDEACFEAWVKGNAFQQGHARPAGGDAASGEASGDDAPRRPVSTGAELWSYSVEQRTSAT